MDCPDVFIYLSDGEHNISFARYPASDFVNPEAKPIICNLKIDKSYTKNVRDDLAGIVKVKSTFLLKKLLFLL